MRQAIAYAIDRKRVNEIASRGTAFEGHGLLPDYYKAFYEQPAEDYPLDVEKANQMLDEAGWQRARRRRRTREGRAAAVVRPVRALGVAGRTSRRPGSCAR